VPTTPVYALPYQSLTDPPDGAALGEDLALAVEAELSRIDADIATLETPPVAQLRQTTAQTGLANGAWTSIAFNAEDIDTHGGHSTVTNNSRYTAQKAGKYRLGGGVAWNTEATGTFWTRWAKGGTEINGSGLNMVTTTSQSMVPARDIIVSLAVGEYVELQSAQFSGGTGDTYVGVAYAQSSMVVQWVSD
jgi:hypothetical protein